MAFHLIALKIANLFITGYSLWFLVLLKFCVTIYGLLSNLFKTCEIVLVSLFKIINYTIHFHIILQISLL